MMSQDHKGIPHQIYSASRLSTKSGSYFALGLIGPIFPGKNKCQDVDRDNDKQHDGLDDEKKIAFFQGNDPFRKEDSDIFTEKKNLERLHEQGNQ